MNQHLTTLPIPTRCTRCGRTADGHILKRSKRKWYKTRYTALCVGTWEKLNEDQAYFSGGLNLDQAPATYHNAPLCQQAIVNSHNKLFALTGAPEDYEPRKWMERGVWELG